MPKFLQIKSMFLRSTIMRNPDCSGWGVFFLPHQMKNTVQEYGGGVDKRMTRFEWWHYIAYHLNSQGLKY